MRIEKIDDEGIYFDNGSRLGSRYYPDCMEENYADFEQIEDLAWAYDFDEDLIFEKVGTFGFRFGDRGQMFFIPCYSIQNGYYENEVDVVYNGNIVLKAVDCEIVSDC
jgi:hypothetical protein